MEEIKTKYLKGNYSEVEDPIILDSTSTTRTVLKCGFTTKGVRGDLWRQKKNKNGTFSDINEIDFRQKDANYGIKIDIPSDGLKNLAIKLYNLFKIRKEYGVEFGENKYITGRDNEILKITDTNKAEVIRDLIEQGYSEEFIIKLKDISPDILERTSKVTIQEKREEKLREYERSIATINDESYWQQFFETNKFIFGYGLNYKILKQIQAQPIYGGTTFQGTGGQRGDFLTSSEGENKYTVLVEIKTPGTKLLSGTEPHHSGAWSLSKSLTDAVTQLQANIDTWNTEGSLNSHNIDLLHSENIFTVTPKGILVIGNQDELLNNSYKIRTFERFRQSLNSIEIITFDELFKRAKFIVNEE